jgi:hypothetical protein
VETPAALPIVEPEPAIVPAQGAVIYSVVRPTRTAHPGEITAAPSSGVKFCRRPEPLPGKRIAGPSICKPKSEWAALRARGLEVAPDGSIYGGTAYEKNRTLAARTCPGIAPGATSAGSWVIGVCI